MRWFVAMVIVVMVLAGAVYCAFETPWVAERIVPVVMNASIDGARVTKCTIADQQVDRNGTFTWQTAVFDIRDAAGTTTIRITELTVSSVFVIPKLLFSEQPIHMQASGVSIVQPAGSVQNVAADLWCVLNARGLVGMKGAAGIGYASFDPWKVTAVHALIEGTPKRLVLSDVTALFYGGSVVGSVTVEDTSAYDVTVNIANVQMAQLARDNPAFAQLGGTANAAVHAQGTFAEIENIQADVSLNKDGMIAAELLVPILDYIPKSTQRTDIERLIAEKKKIPLDTSSVKLKNSGSAVLTADIQLASIQYNLNVNLTIDLNLEGGIVNALSLMQPKAKKK